LPAAANGTPAIRQETLHEAPDGVQNAPDFRLRDLLRGHPAWGTLIVPSQARGIWRFCGPVA
jgi:hypothetical protein